MIRVQIIANSDLKIKKILKQTRISIKEINNCIKNLEKSLDINETNLLKMMNELKSLKFVNFEDLQKKYFYRVLEEEDGIYKGTIGLEQADVFIKEGKGNKECKDGTIFEGEWKNNKREGKGICKYPDGAVYEGEFKNDKREGKGIFKFPDGGVYEGEFKNNKVEGKGIYKDPIGNSKKGEWKDNILIKVEKKN